MFERFLSRYPVVSRAAGTLWDIPELRTVPGYDELWTLAGESPLCDGMLRLVGAGTGPSAQSFIRAGFPEFSTRAVPFAVDWIGRIVGVEPSESRKRDRASLAHHGRFVRQPAFGDYFDIDLVNDPTTFLESDLFRAWLGAGGPIPSIGQCVGFKVPLFLGGLGEVSNLEVTDIDFYWYVSAELRAQTRSFAPGTTIRNIIDG